MNDGVDNPVDESHELLTNEFLIPVMPDDDSKSIYQVDRTR